MAGKKKPPRAKAKDLRKPRKKKVSPIVKDKIEYIDYKDVNLLRAFISDRAKIRGQRVSGNNRHQQRDVAKAIKVAMPNGLSHNEKATGVAAVLIENRATTIENRATKNL